MANPLSQYGISDRDFAAAVATAVGEAGNQDKVGMAAVVDVLNNRTQIDDFSSRFGTSLADQAMARNGREFNAWMPSDRVYPTTKRVYDAIMSGDDSNLSASEKKQMAKAVEATIGVLANGPMEGITQGADSYQAKKTTDKWGTSAAQDAIGKLNGNFVIGDHTFTGHRAFGFTPDNFDLDAAKAANDRNSAWYNAPGQYDPLSSITAKPNGTYDDTAPSALNPGFRFSSMPFGMGVPETPAAPRSYDPLSSIQAPQAPAASPEWGSIAGAAIGAARPPAADYGPDWNTGGPGIPATSTPDYTTGSNGTFQAAPPSTMAPKTTTADTPGWGAIAGQAITDARAPFGFGVNAPMDFSSMKPKLAAVTAAVAAADEEAAQNAKLAAEYKAPNPRDDMYSVAPTVAPETTATPKAVQKAPPAAPVRKPKLAPLPPPQVVRTVPQPREAPKDPGTALSEQFGKPSDFMGSGVSAGDFAKGVAAVAAINGNDLAKSYAAQLTSERPGISGVAFDALSNEYAKATGAPQTKSLLGDIAGAFGIGTAQPQIGASNSPRPQQGMYVQGPNGPTWANYSQGQQQALQNSSGLWGAIQNAFGFGAGQNNGWGGAGSMGYGAGTSGLW